MEAKRGVDISDQRTRILERLKELEPAKRIKKQILAKRHRMNEESEVNGLKEATFKNQ